MEIGNITEQVSLPQDKAFLTLYLAAASGEGLPHIRLLTGDLIRTLGDDLSVVEHEDSGEFRYLFYGAALRLASDTDYCGLTTAAEPPRAGARARRGFSKAIETGAPVYVIDRTPDGGRVPLWGRLHLPFRDSENRTLVVTIHRPREYSESLLRDVLDAAADGIIAVRAIRGPDDTITDCAIYAANAPMADFFQVDRAELTATTLLTLFPHIRDTGIWDKHRAVIKTRQSITFERQQVVGGTNRWYRIVSTPLNDGLVISYTDITELKMLNLKLEEQRNRLEEEVERRTKIEKELWRLAHIDPLTGVANRRSMQEQAMAGLLRARKAGVQCAIICIDIDYFKKINDAFGHAAGDTAIRTLADLARSSLRGEHDVIARMGGEEFAILLYDSSAEIAMAIAERLRATIENTTIPAGADVIQMTVSLGVAISTPQSTFESLHKSADEALYCAKRAGRNRAEHNSGALAA
ncbi:MAG: GGDEF domain-containing protein [Proteobacteria bacterium]|nr:GGDEF domain-containing protein [Pseudomonadota bacterium]